MAPEVDDVTLGRIVLQLMRNLLTGREAADRESAVRGLPRDVTRAAALEVSIRQLATVALTLTELEWKDMPS